MIETPPSGQPVDEPDETTEWPDPADEPAEEPAETLADDGTPGTPGPDPEAA
jgi:hypothetical protein